MSERITYFDFDNAHNPAVNIGRVLVEIRDLLQQRPTETWRVIDGEMFRIVPVFRRCPA